MSDEREEITRPVYVREEITRPVYVTRYGLTRGILVFKTGQLWTARTGTKYFMRGVRGDAWFVEPTYYTFDLEEAKRMVEELVERKVKSLKKQMKKLENFEPAVVEV